MNKPNYIQLSKDLFEKRISIGTIRKPISLEGVSFQTGISKSTLSRVERCVGNIDFKNIVTLAEWLEQPIDRYIINE